MKKIGFLTLILIIAATGGHSQGFYFRAGMGYAFPQAGQTLDGTGTHYNGTVTINTAGNDYSLKNASFSSGVQSSLGFGYMFNDYVGVQLDASIGLSMKQYSSTYINVIYSGVECNETTTQKANTPFLLLPSMVVQSGGDKWNIYGRFGLALPLNTQINVDQVFINQPNISPVDDDYNFTIKNYFSLGFTGAAGVRYNINDRTSVWGELNLLSLAVFIKEADLKGVTSSGYNVPLDSVGGPHVVKYSKNVSVIDSVGNTAASYSQPFSNLSFNVGIIYKLSKNTSHRGHSKHHVPSNNSLLRNQRDNDDLIDK